MRWDRLLYQKTPFNYLLYPFSLLFAIILRLRRSCYQIGLFKVFTPSITTISVGNILCGGSGKTPFTVHLAKLLQDAGHKVAVSHRGYKGKYEHTGRLISDRKGLREFAPEAGDEALLIAEKLPGIPVIVGKERSKAIKVLQQVFPDLDYVILDDSFQHLKVKKNYEFVLFNSITKLGNGFVLPAGILREPLASLQFADCLIYNGKDEVPEKLCRTGKKIIRVSYRISSFYKPDGKIVNSEYLKNKRNVLLSGIGQPDSFSNLILSEGIAVKRHYRFPDHYHYNDKRIMTKLANEIKTNYDYIITTEKDYTKLKRYSDILPLIIVAIEVHSDYREILSTLPL